MGDLGPSRSDLITPIVGKLDETPTKDITSKELNTNGLAVVLAGCQLTTVALATATYLMLRFRETSKRLTEEVGGSFESKSNINTYFYNAAHRPCFAYPINLPRVVPPEGQTINGHCISRGNIIGVSLQNIQSDPDTWVEPRIFHPERILPKTDLKYEQHLDKDNEHSFQSFSAGH